VTDAEFLDDMERRCRECTSEYVEFTLEETQRAERLTDAFTSICMLRMRCLAYQRLRTIECIREGMHLAMKRKLTAP
jgi:hypothetical protein